MHSAIGGPTYQIRYAQEIITAATNERGEIRTVLVDWIRIMKSCIESVVREDAWSNGDSHCAV